MPEEAEVKGIHLFKFDVFPHFPDFATLAPSGWLVIHMMQAL